MKKFGILIVTGLALFLLIPEGALQAAKDGGRGGGGGGKGGGGQGQRSANRTPSMSRASGQNPSRQENKSRPQERPSIKPIAKPGNPQVNKQPNRPVQGASRQEAKKYLQDSKSNRKFDKNISDKRNKDFKDKYRDRYRKDRDNSKRINKRYYQYRPQYRNWFNRNFFDSHHYRPYYYRDGVDWWRAARWGTLGAFLGYGVAYPAYYYESDGYPVQLSNDDINSYQDDTTPVVYNQADNAPFEGDWMPLGVFAVGKDEDEVSQSNMFIQLAINKNGEIAGTYYNSSTDSTRELEGEVDRDTQEAAWKISDSPNSPIASTGLYNLTQDETTIKVRFPNGQEQTWILVRLDDTDK